MKTAEIMKSVSELIAPPTTFDPMYTNKTIVPSRRRKCSFKTVMHKAWLESVTFLHTEMYIVYCYELCNRLTSVSIWLSATLRQLIV